MNIITCSYLDEDYKNAIIKALNKFENNICSISSDVIFKDLPEYIGGAFNQEKNEIYFNANLTVDKFAEWNINSRLKTISQLAYHEIGHSMGIIDEYDANLFAIEIGGINV